MTCLTLRESSSPHHTHHTQSPSTTRSGQRTVFIFLVLQHESEIALLLQYVVAYS